VYLFNGAGLPGMKSHWNFSFTFVQQLDTRAAKTDDAPGARYDVLVWGATPAGITAAVGARRSNPNLRVALAEPSRWIGGMMAGGLGCTDKVHPDSFGGLAREVLDKTQGFYPGDRRLPHCSNAFEPHVATEVFTTLLAEAGVELMLSRSLVSVRRAGAEIVSVELGSSGASPVVAAARVFIDATYEGDLLARAGVSFTVGREGREQYGEGSAGRQRLRPGKCYGFRAPIDPFDGVGKPLPMIWGGALAPEGGADAKVMSYCYRLCLTNVTDKRKRAEIQEPPQYRPELFEAPRRYMRAHPPARLTDVNASSTAGVLKIYAVARSGDGVKANVPPCDWDPQELFLGPKEYLRL
jgi:hypothetical protein